MLTEDLYHAIRNRAKFYLYDESTENSVDLFTLGYLNSFIAELEEIPEVRERLLKRLEMLKISA